VGSAWPSSLVRLYSVVRVTAYPQHTHACVVGGAGWVWTV